MEPLLRLHLSESHAGYSQLARLAVEAELDRLHVYPDPDATELVQTIARHHEVPAGQVIVGNGTDEILFTLTQATLRPGKRVVASRGSFPGYRIAAELAGADVELVDAGGFEVPIDAMIQKSHDVAAVFICNPNNPTGSIATRQALDRLIDAVEADGGIAVFDEAYCHYADREFFSSITALQAHRPVFVMRTLSKAYGLAGLRVGYGLGPPSIIARMKEVRRAFPFSVNRVAQAAAVAALADDAFIREVKERVISARSELCTHLNDLGIGYVPSRTNFMLIETGGSTADFVTRMREEHGILVRDTTGFGFPDHVRISMPMVEQVKELARAIGQTVASLRSDRLPA